MNVGDDDCIGVVEAAAKILEQIAQAGVAMGLNDRDDAPAIGACAPR